MIHYREIFSMRELSVNFVSICEPRVLSIDICMDICIYDEDGHQKLHKS